MEKILGLTFFHGIQLPTSIKELDCARDHIVREITSLR